MYQFDLFSSYYNYIKYNYIKVKQLEIQRTIRKFTFVK